MATEAFSLVRKPGPATEEWIQKSIRASLHGMAQNLAPAVHNAALLMPNGQVPVHTTQNGRLYRGDCVELMGSMGDDSVDLVFADPPFNLKKQYGDHYSDWRSEHEYKSWCEQWIKEATRLLKPGGSFFLYNLPKWNIHNAAFMQTLGLDFRHWITVDMKLGLPVPGKLYPSHYSLLYFSNGRPATFVRPRIPIKVCRHCGKDINDYGGHRSKIHPDGVNLTDVWTDIPPVRHRRTKNRSANELSEKLLERVLSIGSQQGDLILDPFGGSGTTYIVAERLERKWVGMELGDTDVIINRLTGVENVVAPPSLGDSRKGAKKSMEK